MEEFYHDLENGPDPSQEISNAFQSFRHSLLSVAGLSDVDRNTMQMSLQGLERTVEGQCARLVNRIMSRQADSAEAEGSLPANEEFGEDANWRAQVQ